ncbi:MAG: amidohydrolase [Acidimicrobiales bacterium]|nr:amidohydrolase [Acidimicrobiales bacterium]MCB9371482.1 amidohydrolase [Microthrixaceae bacterium]
MARATAVRPHHPGSPPASCGCGGPFVAGLGALAPRPTALPPVPTHRAHDGRATVVRGATVLTMDPASTVAGAIAFRDGRIVAVGDGDEVAAAAGRDARVVDADGAVVLPGFIEPHAHLVPTALLGGWHDVGAARFPTVDSVIEHLAGLAADVPRGGWLTARQFDPSLQAGPSELTTDLLDRASTEVPVLVLNASLHFAYANSAALRVAGVDRDTPDPEHSPYGRYADGTPNGVLVGQAAMLSVATHDPRMLATDLVAEGRAVARRAASVGITTICDQGTGMVLGPEDADLYRAMADDDGLATRLRYSALDNRADAWDLVGLAPGDGDDRIRATGWKIISDGSNQGRTGHQRTPYLGSTDRGLPYVEPAELAARARHRAAQGWQVVIHANGDQAIDDTLAALAGAVDAGGPDRRHRIEHCSLLHDDQIARIAELGVSPSFLIGHVHYWGQAFRDEILGSERADLLDRTASCSAAGIRWTVHSDEMVTAMGPLRCVHNAVTRELWREPGTVLTPGERVPVESALRAVTADAAWQCHSDHEIGTLEVGKRADLVVLGGDPRTVDPGDLAEIEVLETWMDGVRRH